MPEPDANGRLAVRVADIAYSYPSGTQALADVSIDVSSKDVVAVVGPSGCGKSTLLTLITGYTRPAAGEIVWGSSVVADTSRPRMTLLFQKDTLLPWKTVSGNVRIGLKYLGVPKAEQRERAEWLLGLVGLADVADSYPYQLSGGMRRRVAFLASIAPMPSVLLLDEPFSALDEPTRIEVHREVLKIVRQVGTSVILVTHDIAEAVSLADRVCVLTKGPGRVAAEIPIDFGPDRDVTTIREDPAFLEKYSHVWHVLHEQINA